MSSTKTAQGTVEGRTIVITGGSDGIGAVAARKLAEQGANVIITGRNPEKTASVAAEVDSPVLTADFADLAQVRRLAGELAEAAPRIDVLVNNAGGLFKTGRTTKDGHEPNFQINHLAPFLLTNLIKPQLLASDERRIVVTSSMANNWGKVKLDDLDGRKSDNIAYGTGKLLNILFARGITRQWADESFVACAFHPGIVRSNFGNDSILVKPMYQLGRLTGRVIDSEKGATPIVDLVAREPRESINGNFYFRHKAGGKENGQASDEQLQDDLWERSVELVNL
jgi:NAD(P)-dependent dehydrogenase (short-subunit alcohol dehydrogenase family)